jgi:tetratricopeptide (TPR) repeat protein
MNPAAETGDRLPAALERLAEEMVERWRRGERPQAEEFLDRCPVLWDHPDAALELIAEELALRDEYGLPADPDELAGRFPRWRPQVKALLDCQRALGPPRFPEPGETLGDFQLVSELGRGAHGRVYLAVQPALSGRPVVLKVSPDTGSEHLSLARLQHTHVVPLHSVHEFPDRRLRALCMPYFDGATLADLLRAGRPTSGKDLLAALRQVESEETDSVPVRGPAWRFLERASVSEAACWVGACLADALQYAHDRGLLHLDLKPSNVLLAADGVPMLLDFHVARPPLRAGEAAVAWLGGTPGHMAPEQAAALRAVRDGRAVPQAVDARADVYSLGVLLTELLGGPTRSVSVGLADVLARCTAADPADRYPTAAALAADLRRHLSDLPLKGVGNRSLAERWGKWRRRRPHALPLALTLVALAAVTAGLALRVNRQADRAEKALRDGEVRLDQGRYAEAVEALRGGEGLVEGSPFHRSLLARLREARQAAERGQAAAELHLLCERVRPLYAAEVVAPEQARTAAANCLDVWAERAAIVRKLDGQPNPELEWQWRADLLDVGILAAHLGVRSTPPEEADAARRRALATLAEAEALLGPSGVLYLERARHARALGMSRLADEADELARTVPPRTAWEHLAVGRALMGAGEISRASVELDRSVELDPRSLWANYYRGAGRLRLGEPTEAVAAFSACVALAPDAAWCFYNRGLAYTEANHLDRAVADFDRALDLDPSLAAAYLGRAAAHHRAGRHSDALADLHRAADGGLPPADVQYQTAVVLLALKDRPAALASLRDCLRHDPHHQPARDLLAKMNAQP